MYGDLFSVVTSLATLGNLYTGVSPTTFWAAPIIFSCFGYDLIFGTPNRAHILHHWVSTAMGLYFVNMRPENLILNYGVQTFLQTELSVPFYVFVPYVKPWPVLSALNYVLFAASFFWFRIINLYFNFIRTRGFVESLAQHKIFCGGFFLMGLNFYWMAKIFRVVSKAFNHVNCEPICHRVVSYMYFGNVAIVLYMNDWQWNADVWVNAALSATSYAYHQSAIEPTILTPYLLNLDNALIHLRCLPPLFALLEPRSAMILAVNHGVMYIGFLDTGNYNFTYFATGLDFIVCAVVAVDSIQRLDILTCLYLFALCATIEPFRKMTHVATHALLWWLSYLLAHQQITQGHTLCSGIAGLCQ